MAARDAKDVATFAKAIKAIHSYCTSAHVAITGSSMMSLLRALQGVASEAHLHRAEAVRIHLGALPPDETTEGIASQILSLHDKDWPVHLRDYVSVAQLLTRLTPKPEDAVGMMLTAPRPALITWLADVISNTPNKTQAAPAVLAAAVQHVRNKLAEEVRADARVALPALSLQQRTLLRRAAAGTASRTEAKRQILGNHLANTLFALSQPVEPGQSREAAAAICRRHSSAGAS